MPRVGTVLALVTAMRVALPIWSNRISPVLDVCQRLLVVDVEDGAEIARHEEALLGQDLRARAAQVTGLGIQTLICGAVSWPLEELLANSGVHVISNTCGCTEDVLQAFIAGELSEDIFLMPGCCGRRRRGRRGHGRQGRGRRQWNNNRQGGFR